MEPLEGSFGRLLDTNPRNPRPDNTSFQHMPNFAPNTFNLTQFPTPTTTIQPLSLSPT